MIAKAVLKSIVAILGGSLMLNAVFLMLVANFNTGQLITFLCGALLILYVFLFERIQNATKSGLLRLIKYACYSGAVLVMCIIAVIAVYGNYDTITYEEDALIVLGAGIRGEVITYPLMHRLNKAVEYHEKNADAVIVVSGGQGPQEDITEALAMERYLLKKGIPRDKILKEECSTSTFENFSYSKEVLDNQFKKPYKIAFITNDFHIYRASRLAKIAGINAAHMHAKIEWYTIPANYLREAMAVVKLWMLKS